MVAAKVWNGSSWEYVGGAVTAAVQPGPPSGPALGQLWLDTDELAAGQGQGPYVCTSTTRPSSPSVGMQIYEADTGLSLQYVTGTTYAGWYVVGALSGSAAPVVSNADSSSSTVTNDGTWYSMLGAANIALGAQWWKVETAFSFEWNAASNAACYVRSVVGGVEVERVRCHNQSTGYNIFKTAFIGGTSAINFTGTTSVAFQVSVDTGGVAVQFANISGRWRGVRC